MDLKILVRKALTGSFGPARTAFATKNRLIRINAGQPRQIFAPRNSLCVMEYVEGISLAELLDKSPTHYLPVKQVEQIAKGILSALDYTHRQGIIHRDIKPSNILLDRQGRAHLIDFGIALAIGEVRRTRTGQIIGSPYYMSPEQIRTHKKH